MGIAELQSQRLLLKKPGPDDLDALVAQIGDWEVAKWLSRVPYPYTLDDARDWLDSNRLHALNFNIYRRDSLIGGVGLTADDDDYFELGYWLGRDHWGNGYATEAARCLLDHATNELKMSNIKSSYMLGNGDSANVLKKLGFREIGESEIYSIALGESRPCVKLELA